MHTFSPRRLYNFFLSWAIVRRKTKEGDTSLEPRASHWLAPAVNTFSEHPVLTEISSRIVGIRRYSMVSLGHPDKAVTRM